MKTRILVISTALLLGACANLTPAQQTALSDVTKTALAAGTGYLTGGAVGAGAAAAPDLAADLSDAALALRQNETGAGAAPTAALLTTAIQAVAVNPAVAKAVGPKVSSAISAAVQSGATPDAALEAGAIGLEQAAATATTK